MEEKPEENSITSEISKEYIPRLVETSTFKNGNCNEKYIRSHLKLTLDDLFMVAGETQKPVGIYIDGTPPFSSDKEKQEHSVYSPRVVFFMIFNPKNLSLIKVSINTITKTVFSRDIDNKDYFESNIMFSAFSRKSRTIEEAYNYILDNLYYKNPNTDTNVDRRQLYYLVDPMSRLYVANQIFSNCKNKHRLYFSSYVEEPKPSDLSNLYYLMILVLLERRPIPKLTFISNEALLRYKQEVLDDPCRESNSCFFNTLKIP